MAEKLLNVHQILKDASLAKEPLDDQKTVATFRIPTKTKLTAETICQGNGTDLSKFLRRCCEQLVADYTGETI